MLKIHLLVFLPSGNFGKIKFTSILQYIMSSFVVHIDLHLIKSHVWSKFSTISNLIFYVCFNLFVIIVT